MGIAWRSCVKETCWTRVKLLIGANQKVGIANANDTFNHGSGVPGDAMDVVRTKTNGALQSAET